MQGAVLAVYAMQVCIHTISVSEGTGYECCRGLPPLLCKGSRVYAGDAPYTLTCIMYKAYLLCTVPTGSSNSFWRTNRCGFGTPGFSILSKVATVTLCLWGCAEAETLDKCFPCNLTRPVQWATSVQTVHTF